MGAGCSGSTSDYDSTVKDLDEGGLVDNNPLPVFLEKLIDREKIELYSHSNSYMHYNKNKI